MPDWGTITLSGASSALLTAIVLAFWKPWLGGYAGEKGKNLARKEDLQRIIDEVSAITTIQRQIETTLTKTLWDTQVQWQQKRDTYARLLEVRQRLFDAASAINVWIPKQEDLNLAVRLSAAQRVAKGMDDFNEAQSEFTHVMALAIIFTNADCIKLLSEYVNGRHLAGGTPEEKAKQELMALMPLMKLSVVAKQDLGIT